MWKLSGLILEKSTWMFITHHAQLQFANQFSHEWNLLNWTYTSIINHFLRLHLSFTKGYHEPTFPRHHRNPLDAVVVALSALLSPPLNGSTQIPPMCAPSLTFSNSNFAPIPGDNIHKFIYVTRLCVLTRDTKKSSRSRHKRAYLAWWHGTIFYSQSPAGGSAGCQIRWLGTSTSH